MPGKRLIEIRLKRISLTFNGIVQFRVNRKRRVILQLQDLTGRVLVNPPGQFKRGAAHAVKSPDRAAIPDRHVQIIGGGCRNRRHQQHQAARHRAPDLTP